MRKLYLVYILALLFGCSEEHNPGGDVMGNELITLSTSVTAADSKASMVVDQSDFTTVGLYCAHTGSSSWSTSTTDFSKMNNTRLTYKDEKWEYDEGEEVRWGNTSLTDKYTFFGYAPHSTTDNVTISPAISGGELTLSYTCPFSAAYQKDLLLAEPRKDIYPQMGGKVTMMMDHALSCISFSVKADPSVTISSIKIVGDLCSKGRVKRTASDDIEWVDPTITTGAIYETTSFVSNTSFSYTTPTDITADDGYLMLIPQSIPTGAKLVVEGELGGTEFSSELAIDNTAITAWQSTKRYNYTLTLDLNILRSFTVTESSWEAGSDLNIYTSTSTDVDPLLWIDITNMTSTTQLETEITNRLTVHNAETIVFTGEYTGDFDLGNKDYQSTGEGLNKTITINSITIGIKNIDLSRVSGLTDLPEYIFCNNETVEQIILPKGVKSLEDRAFMYCDNLISVEPLTEVTSVGSWVFWSCSKLKSINMPNLEECTESAGNVFRGCDVLESLDLPKLRNAPFGTFADNKSLKILNIPSVTEISNLAFRNINDDVDIYLTSTSHPINLIFNEDNDDWSTYNLYIHESTVIDEDFIVKSYSTKDILYNGVDGYTWKSINYVDDDGNVVRTE